MTAVVPLAFLIFGLIAVAQELSPGEVRLSSRPYEPRPILRSVSQLVQLEVVVRDTHGRAVPGLTKDDFAPFGWIAVAETTWRIARGPVNLREAQ
ncbi:MAG: hypothetical protein WA789_02360 [Candidatus Acidiferrum sp.]